MQTSHISQVPALTPLSLSHLCAKYLRAQFQNKLNSRSSGTSATPLAQPLLLPVALASELDIIAATLANAFSNCKGVGWDVTRYVDMLPKKPSKPGTKKAHEKEASLRRRYPPLDGVTASLPCIIVDMQGIILAWYLPGILTDSRQETGRLSECNVGGARKAAPIAGKLILNQAMVQQHPQVLANFSSPAALDWLDAASESNSILSAILAVIHPTLYDAGRQTVKCLRNTPEIDPQDVLSRWASVFSGVAVISNRSTPLHRDGSLRYQWPWDISGVWPWHCGGHIRTSVRAFGATF
ncbi:hypothetical protein V8E52_011699 [Russula decolorans]